MDIGGVAPAGGDRDRGSTFIAIFWIECTLAIIVIGLRFWGRCLIKKVGADDWIMLFSFLLFVGWTCLGTLYAHLGGVRHMRYLVAADADVKRIISLNFLLQFIATFTYAPAKTSVAAMILRIMDPHRMNNNGGWRKWLIYGTVVVIWVATIVNIVIIYAQCSPPSALWDKDIPHKCWSPNVQGNDAYFTSALNVFADVILAVVPASMIWGLQMDIRRRVSLSILLGLGIIAAISAAIKTFYLSQLSARADMTWDTYEVIIWAGSEVFVLVFCGSIPPLKILWDRYVKRSSYLSSQATPHPGESFEVKPYSSRAVRFGESDVGSDDARKDGISATTDIEITSSRVWHHAV